MTFVQARNRIISGLETHVGCPVILSDQIADMPDYPYCYYSTLAPRVRDRFFGLKSLVEKNGGWLRTREEQVTATLSLTFCSMNRDSPDGFIFGEDEALRLAEKANGFFLLDAHLLSSDEGDVVVYNVGDVANRSGFFVDDTVRRYGFDVRFAYVRKDEMPTATILKPGNQIGNAHS